MKMACLALPLDVTWYTALGNSIRKDRAMELPYQNTNKMPGCKTWPISDPYLSKKSWFSELLCSYITKLFAIQFQCQTSHLALTCALTSCSNLSPSSSAVTSYCDCNPSQNSADIPKNFASLSAVSGVIPRMALAQQGNYPLFPIRISFSLDNRRPYKCWVAF